jgi:hypothetical protein
VSVNLRIYGALADDSAIMIQFFSSCPGKIEMMDYTLFANNLERLSQLAADEAGDREVRAASIQGETESLKSVRRRRGSASWRKWAFYLRQRSAKPCSANEDGPHLPAMRRQVCDS